MVKPKQLPLIVLNVIDQITTHIMIYATVVVLTQIKPELAEMVHYLILIYITFNNFEKVHLPVRSMIRWVESV